MFSSSFIFKYTGFSSRTKTKNAWHTFSTQVFSRFPNAPCFRCDSFLYELFTCSQLATRNHNHDPFVGGRGRRIFDQEVDMYDKCRKGIAKIKAIPAGSQHLHHLTKHWKTVQMSSRKLIKSAALMKELRNKVQVMKGTEAVRVWIN